MPYIRHQVLCTIGATGGVLSRVHTLRFVDNNVLSNAWTSHLATIDAQAPSVFNPTVSSHPAPMLWDERTRSERRVASVHPSTRGFLSYFDFERVVHTYGRRYDSGKISLGRGAQSKVPHTRVGTGQGDRLNVIEALTLVPSFDS